MKLAGENRSTRGKTCANATLSTTNPTWTDPGSNPVLRGGWPATNRLSHGTAFNAHITHPFIHPYIPSFIPVTRLSLSLCPVPSCFSSLHFVSLLMHRQSCFMTTPSKVRTHPKFSSLQACFEHSYDWWQKCAFRKCNEGRSLQGFL